MMGEAGRELHHQSGFCRPSRCARMYVPRYLHSWCGPVGERAARMLLGPGLEHHHKRASRVQEDYSSQRRQTCLGKKDEICVSFTYLIQLDQR